MAHHGQGERSQTDRNYTETCSIHRWLIIIKSKTVTFFNKTSSFFNLLSIEKVKSYRMSNLVYKNVRSTFECKQSFRNSMGQLGLKSFESLLNHLHVLKKLIFTFHREPLLRSHGVLRDYIRPEWWVLWLHRLYFWIPLHTKVLPSSLETRPPELQHPRRNQRGATQGRTSYCWLTVFKITHLIGDWGVNFNIFKSIFITMQRSNWMITN